MRKHTGHRRMGALLVVLALLISLAVPAAAEQAMQYIPWKTYTLGILYATDDPAVVSYTSAEEPDARYVLVYFSGLGEMIRLADIQENANDFVLRDADGSERGYSVYSASQLEIKDGNLSMAAEQDGFGLIFNVPSASSVDEMTLLVATDNPAERIIVSLNKVSRVIPDAQGAVPVPEEEPAADPVPETQPEPEPEPVSEPTIEPKPDYMPPRDEAPAEEPMPEPESEQIGEESPAAPAEEAPAEDVPTDAPVEEPAEEPAEEPEYDLRPMGVIMAEALGSDLYMQTYLYLEDYENDPLGNGSKGDAARGLQQLIVDLGGNITVDGAIGKKTMTALEEVTWGIVQRGESGSIEQIDDYDFEQMMLALLVRTDREKATEVLLKEDDAYPEGVFEFFDAIEEAKKGNYYTAMQVFDSKGSYMNGDYWAEMCIQDWPKNGEVYRNSAYSSKKSSLTIKTGLDSDYATYVKIYTTDGDLVLGVFIAGTGNTTVKLPVGEYIVKTGTGTTWFGPNEAFGNEYDANYNVLQFDGGGEVMTVEANYSYTLTLQMLEEDEGNVGSYGENWNNF